MCLRQDKLAQLFVYEGTVDKIMSLHISVSTMLPIKPSVAAAAPHWGTPRGIQDGEKDDVTLPWIAKMHTLKE